MERDLQERVQERVVVQERAKARDRVEWVEWALVAVETVNARTVAKKLPTRGALLATK